MVKRSRHNAGFFRVSLYDHYYTGTAPWVHSVLSAGCFNCFSATNYYKEVEFRAIRDVAAAGYNSPMDNTITNWNEVHDPEGEVQIIATFALVKGHYDPNEVQILINEYGMRDAVRRINSELAPLIGVSPLFLTNVGGKKTLGESLPVK